MAFDPNEFEAAPAELAPVPAPEAVPTPPAPSAAPLGAPGPAPAPQGGPAPFDPAQFEAWDSQSGAAPAPSGRINMVGPQGELVDVADTEADVAGAYAQGFRLDPNDVTPSADAIFLLENGTVNQYTRNDPELRSRFAAGAQIATPAEARAEFEDLGSQVATFTESAAQGATLGAYGVVADGLAGDNYTAERTLREDMNPGTALAGNIAGAVAPAILSGGTGAIASAARMTPAARLAALGGRVAETLSARATSAGGRILASTLANAGEGALDNAIRTVADDIARGDTEITAERVLESAWEGALWGGIAGGGISAIGEGISAVGKSRAARRAAAEVTPDDVLDVPPATPDAPRRASAEVEADLEAARQKLAEADAIGEPLAAEDAQRVVLDLEAERDASLVSEAGMLSDDAIDLTLKVEQTEEAKGLWDRLKEGVQRAQNAKEAEAALDEAIDQQTRSMTTRLDDLQRIKQNEIDPAISRNNKPKAIAAALEREGVVWTVEKAERILAENQELIAVIDELRATYPLGDEVMRKKLGPLKAAREALEGIQKHLTDIKGTGPISPESRILRGDLESVAQVFWAEDNLKSYLGSIAKKKGEVLTQAEARLQQIYMGKRSMLQDKRLWGGELSNMQTVTNAIESRAIPAGRAFHSLFGRSKQLLGEHAGEFGFEELMEMDPARIKGLLRSLGDADNYKDEADFIRGLFRSIELAETKAKYYPLSDAQRMRLAEGRALVEGVVSDLKTVKVLKQRRDMAVKLAKGTEDFARVKLALDLAGAFIPGAHLVGRIPGVIASGIAMLSGKPGARVGKTVTEVSESAVKQERLFQRTVTTASRNLLDSAAPAVKRVPVGMTANQIRRAVEQAQELEDPNSPASLRLSAMLEDIADESPELAESIQASTLAKARFILDKAGPREVQTDPLSPPKLLVDPIRERKAGKYIAAAEAPLKALERLGNGTGSIEDLETLQALYPRQYQRWVDSVVEQASRTKKRPTMRQRQLLHFATGVPMTFGQANIGAFATLHANAPEAAPGMPGAPAALSKKAAPLDTNADQVMARSDAIMSPGAG